MLLISSETQVRFLPPAYGNFLEALWKDIFNENFEVLSLNFKFK